MDNDRQLIDWLIQRHWPTSDKYGYDLAFQIEELIEVLCGPGPPEVAAVRTCRSGRCRRIRTCRRPQTCREPAMVQHREFMEIAAEMAAKEGIPNPFAPPKT